MRIAYVPTGYRPTVGGVETHVEQIATRVAARGHQVEVLVQEHDRSLPRVELLDGAIIRRFSVPIPSVNYAVSPGLWAYLQRHGTDYDLVHAHCYHRLPALWAALARSPVFIFTPHYHGTGHSPLRRLLHGPYRTVGKHIFSRSSYVICVSEAEAALVRRHFPRVKSRLRIIPNGVDVAALKRATPYHERHAVVLSAGRLEAYKNVNRIVEAFGHLEEEFTLRITGQGPAAPLLEALIGQLGLGGRARLLGAIPAESLRRWFRTAAVYVSMSSEEASGVAVHEALAVGAGVVASDIPAHREVANRVGSEVMTLVPLDCPANDLAVAIRAQARRQQGGALPSIHVPPWDEVATRTLELYQLAVDAQP